MKTVLITGGPVHGKIDDVKLVTNKFKGGRIASLADKLYAHYNVIYLCAKGSILPINKGIVIVYHDGVYDYMNKVLELAVKCDAVILGAAVANLIPVKPFEGKFPSHNYKPGDIIPIDFQIAPRIVDKVKQVNPKTKLFAFKLLSGVDYDTLIEAAYDIVLDSKAVCVFANDAKNLNVKYAVTKEKSVIPLTEDNYHNFIIDCIEDEYFSTEIVDVKDYEDYKINFWGYYNIYKNDFSYNGKYTFGTIAVRTAEGFITTVRGKDEFSSIGSVVGVDFENKKIYADKKVSLNAPLLYKIFEDNPTCVAIIHTHYIDDDYDILPYAIPGTVRDSNRYVESNFNIDHHGYFILIKKNKNDI